MNHKAIRSLVLLIVTTALQRTGMLAAEPLPPRALARIGDHRFYHGPGIVCAVLSPDGRRIASAANCWDGDFSPIGENNQEDYNRTLILWDAITGDRLRECRVPRGPISCLAFSPDGQWLAANCGFSDIEWGVAIFEVETGKMSQRLDNFKNERHSLHFSRNGKQLHISEKRGPVSVWDSTSGRRLRLWKPPPREPAHEGKNNLSAGNGLLSPDGKVIVWDMGWNEGPEGAESWHSVSLRVQDAATDKLLYCKNTKALQDRSNLLFSADGRRLAAYCADRLVVWDATTGKERGVIEGQGGQSFALTPDGQRLVFHPGPEQFYYRRAEDDLPLSLWSIESGKRLREIALDFVTFGPNPLSNPQPFSADGKTLLLAFSPTLRLFDITKGKEHFRASHRSPVTPRFSADGRTLFTSCIARRCRWDISGTRPVLLAEESRKSWDYGLAYSADDRLLLDVSGMPIRLREAATGRILCKLEGVFSFNFGFFSPNAMKALLTVLRVDNGFKREEIRIYDLRIGRTTGAIAPTASRGLPMFSPDGRLIAWAAGDGVVHLYDAVTGKAVRTLHSSKPLPEPDIRHAQVLFSPDGELLIVTTYETSVGLSTAQPTRVFQISNGREILRFYANPKKTNKADPHSCMACSPDGRLLAVTEKYSGTIRLLEIASGKVRAEFAGHRHGVRGLAFAPDGQTLASGGEDNVVFLWDVTGARMGVAVKKTAAAWWSDLASEDAKRASDAIAGLLRKSEASVAFLQERLRPAEVADEKLLMRLLADLDGDAFAKREAASHELARLGERAEVVLRRALKNHPSLEARRRIEDLLGKLERATLPAETLRTLRAIEILEHIGTPAARQSLDALAKGAPAARETQEAKRALQRLAKRR